MNLADVAQTVHFYLETLYYAAGVALAFVAWKGLEQLRISRDVARISAKREAFKLAAEQCKYFAETIIHSGEILFSLCESKKVSFLFSQYEIKEGEIVNHTFP